MNHFVKRRLLWWLGIDSPPVTSVTGDLSVVHHTMPTVFTAACHIWRPYFFFRRPEVHIKDFDAGAKQCVVTVVQCCAFGPLGRGLHSTEDKVSWFLCCRKVKWGTRIQIWRVVQHVCYLWRWCLLSVSQLRPLPVLVIKTFATAFSSFRVVLPFFEMQYYTLISSYSVLFIPLRLDILFRLAIVHSCAIWRIK